MRRPLHWPVNGALALSASKREVLLSAQVNPGYLPDSENRSASFSRLPRSQLLCMQSNVPIATRVLPAVAKHKTPEDKLWLALANLTAECRVQLSVSQRDNAQACHGIASTVLESLAYLGQ